MAGANGHLDHVDLFDVYDKVRTELVDQSHLDTRINTLKLGVMKTANTKMVFYWKNNRSPAFVDWFESEILARTQTSMDINLSEQERTGTEIQIRAGEPNASNGTTTHDTKRRSTLARGTILCSEFFGENAR